MIEEPTRECLRGCAGTPALHGSLLCARCLRRLRNTLNEVPDLCALLRSVVDPLRSSWNFGQSHGTASGFSRPPTSPDLLDAADAVLWIVTHYAVLFGDPMVYDRPVFESGTGAVTAYYRAAVPVGYLLTHLSVIANDRRVGDLAAAVVDSPADAAPNEVVTWTVAKVMGRWPLRDRVRWAKEPCPECSMLSVRVRPPRGIREPTTFWCTNEDCEWDPQDPAEWAGYFETVWDTPTRVESRTGRHEWETTRGGTK